MPLKGAYSWGVVISCSDGGGLLGPDRAGGSRSALYSCSEDIAEVMRLLALSLECFLFSYMELGMMFEKP